MINQRQIPLLAAALLFLLAGCERLEHAIGDHEAPSWQHAGTAVAPPIEGADRFTAEIETVPVHAAPGETPFQVAARTPHLQQAPCTQCHTPDGKAKRPEGSPRPAHWQITRAHGAANDLKCSTCHPADKPETLATIHGKPVEYDHSYELCGTCHFEQLRDWRGGAHGKRLGAWSGERVTQTCTGCHNPHEPGFPVRMPSTHTPHPEQPGDRKDQR